MANPPTRYKITRQGLGLNSNKTFKGCSMVKRPMPSELFYEVINVCTDFVWFFLVYKMGYPFHHNYFLQKWYISLKTTIVYIFLHTWNVISEVQVSHDKLNRNFNWKPCPCCCELPASARKIKKKWQISPVSYPRNSKVLF